MALKFKIQSQNHAQTQPRTEALPHAHRLTHKDARPQPSELTDTDYSSKNAQHERYLLATQRPSSNERQEVHHRERWLWYFEQLTKTMEGTHRID